MKSNNQIDSIIDKAIARIAEAPVDAATMDAAVERVWTQLSVEAAGSIKAAPPAVEQIESCADFQSLIPGFLLGTLSEARSLLLEDHTHECIPCRKALKQARAQRVVPARQVAKSRRFQIQPVILRWGIAAAVVIGFGLLALPFIQRYSPFGPQFEATVQAAEGQVFQIDDTHSLPVAAGEKLDRNERLRTAKDAHAFVRLGDGSTIELKDRSELYLTRNALGTTIHLERGSIMVEAAKQNGQHLYVDTGDSLVSVTGTIFSVNSGTKGSRVSVIEGEVHLDHAGSDRLLRAGQQATTNPAIETVSVKDEVAWSRKAAQYASQLANLAVIGTELNRVARPGVRNSTHLLDLMPESTIVYAALPNLATTLVESHRILQERINQNPALKEWWDKEEAGRKARIDEVMNTIREFGDYLGDEIAVSVSMNEKGEPEAPLVLAELKNSEGFRQFLEQQIAKYSGQSQGRPNIQFVDDPLTATSSSASGSKQDQLYVWIQKDLFAASPKLEQIQNVSKAVAAGNTSSFTATPFHDRIAQVYQEGAGLVVAANLEKIVEQTKTERLKDAEAARQEQALNQLGILSVKYFVLDQKDSDGKTHTKAVLSFNDPQRGIPSWLAAPAPMGSLEYISPDANVVAGFVVKDPQRLVDDLLGVVETVSPDLRKNLDKLQADHGFDIRNDIAAPLGGEFAFAIDGPILPTPSWKMVFEVHDTQHLQQTMERLVGEINKEAAKFGKAGLTWDRTDDSGRVFYTLHSADFGVEVSYTYVNGYLIVGPSKALVERALKSHEAGYTLPHSAKFLAGLPTDGNANFSALFFHNLAPLVQPFANRIASSANSLPKEQQEAIKAMAGNLPPTLAYAYAQGDSISFAANTEGGPFGLSPATLLGVPNALEMQHIIKQGMGTK